VVKKQYKKLHNNKKKIKILKMFLSVIKFGSCGLKALGYGYLNGKQLETARRVISRITKRIGKIIFRIFFFQSVTKKPLLSRMGKGSGVIIIWVAYIRKGMILFELKNIPFLIATKALRSASLRLPLQVNLIHRELA
jgi:large subunit ribosomal protein L16